MTRALSLICLLTGALLVAPAAAADRAIVLEGDSAPGTSGGTISFPGLPALNASEQVAFRSDVSGGTASEGIFLDTGSGLVAVALVGAPAPDSGGATFFDFGEAAINDAGQVAFSAQLTGGTATRGLYRYDAGVLTALATTATTAPDTGGGNYTAFGSRISLNELGEVAFVATVGSGTTTEGVFVEDGSTGRSVFLIGASAPAGAAGTYFDFSPPVIDDAGAVAVWASVFLDPGFVSGIVVTGTPDRFAALVGETAPDTNSGTYSVFNSSAAPGLDASGNVYFRANVASGTASSGLFVDEAGTDAAVVLQGDPAPDTGGNFFSFVDGNGFSVNDGGSVGFSAGILGGSVGQGVFKSPPSAPVESLALVGQTAPDAAPATYLTLGDGASLNADGLAAFRSNLLGGTTARGIFLVPEPAGAATWATAVSVLAFLRRRSERSRSREAGDR